jgi:hypothetical protein
MTHNFREFHGGDSHNMYQPFTMLATTTTKLRDQFPHVADGEVTIYAADVYAEPH